MVKEAEANAEEDKKKRERITVKNNLDNLVYGTEKLLKDNGEKVSAEAKSEIEGALKEAKEALQKDDADEMKRLHDKLTSLSHKLAEEMYKSSAQGGAAGGQSGAQPGGGASGKKEDEPIEAEYREEKGE